MKDSWDTMTAGNSIDTRAECMAHMSTAQRASALAVQWDDLMAVMTDYEGCPLGDFKDCDEGSSDG
jgi:hypothetical protein